MGKLATIQRVVGADPDLQVKIASENGPVTPDSGFDGLSLVNVNVQPPLQEKTTTQNGEVVADAEYYGLSKVNVDVPAPPLSRRTIRVNGVYNAENEGLNGYSEVEVDVPDNSGYGQSDNTITFYDYDGTILRRINLDQLPITELDLPTPPPHEYLIFSGWTHTLSEINETETGLNVGAVYDTVGGKTYAFIEVNDSTGYNVPLNIRKTGADTTLSIKVFDTDNETEVIDIVDTSVGTISHVLYLPSIPQKKYRVELYVTEGSGTYSLGGGSNSLTFIGSNNRNYRETLLKVFVGNNNVTRIESYAFYQCYSLTNVTISNSVTSLESDAFESCRSLTSVTIPSSVTGIGGFVFDSCYSLTSAVIPNSVTYMPTFRNCRSLASVTIPNSVTTVGQAFDGCSSLTNITIPNNVTSIGSYGFRTCYLLTGVAIPSSITSIGTQMFEGCYSLRIVDMTEFDVVLTLPSTSVFSGIPAIFKIKVKQSMVDAYKTATNWSVYATNIVGVEV
jgi:hypothetical protein